MGLSIEHGWMCEQNEHWSHEVVGSKGNKYTVTFGFMPTGPVEHDFSCTCPAWQHGTTRPCKHIKAVKHMKCTWHTQFDGGEPDELHGEPVCPRCGGPVKAIRYAV